MDIWLGIDGGGTKTRAVLGRADGSVVGEGEAGPSNYHNLGIERAIAAIRLATERAWAAAGMKFSEARGAFLGCAGVKSSVDISTMQAAAESAGLAPAGEIRVANDLHNALAGGLGGRPGIALIAGTGTNCLGRDASGRSFMCGGWGWFLDDEGGGFGLARAAMQAAVRSADGRAPATRLLPAVLAFLGLNEPNEILARLYVRPWTAGELAGFAPVVSRLAEEGDATAKEVLTGGARSLAALVRGVAGQLDFPEGPDVVILGGCALSGAPYQPLVEAAIRRAVPGARLCEPQFSPARGALINAIAFSAAGKSPSRPRRTSSKKSHAR